MYHFSDAQSHEFYGRNFYEILDEGGKVVAFSEAKFKIGPEVRFAGNAKIFASASIWGGVIRGGEIWGGVIRGGVIRGGEIRGGVIRGGVIWGGVYKKTLMQIQGSRHFCYATPTDAGKIELGIGCCIYPISEWKEKYIAIGKMDGYTDLEIEEYGHYIALYEKMYSE